MLWVVPAKAKWLQGNPELEGIALEMSRLRGSRGSGLVLGSREKRADLPRARATHTEARARHSY